jgi:hypothetical protein
MRPTVSILTTGVGPNQASGVGPVPLDKPSAASTADDPNVDATFAVQLDLETGGRWAGVEIEEEALHLRLAAAFGALALVVTQSQLIELGPDGTRRWELIPTNDRPDGPRLELAEIY